MSEESATTTATEQEQTTAATTQEQQEQEQQRTFTQDEVNRFLARERKALDSRLAEVETLREKAERYDELAEQGKTAEQKLQESLANRERELEDLRRNHQETLVASATTLAAGKLGVVDPEAVTKLIDWSALEYDEQGRPTNVEELVTSLVAEKSYLTAKPSNGPTFDGGARQPAPSTTDDPKLALGLGLRDALNAGRP